MAKEEIGFKHGVPEDPDRTWEQPIDGTTFVFTKARHKKKFFLYKCAQGDAETSWVSDRDLSPEAIEQAPQFSSFLSGYKART